MKQPIKNKKPASSALRIVLGSNTLANYPEGGGHWTCCLQYFLGLKALGYDVFWLEVLRPTKTKIHGDYLAKKFFQRMKQYGLNNRCLLLRGELRKTLNLDTANVEGMSKLKACELVRNADLLWNLACSLRMPLLAEFKRRVLIDIDPGHLQVGALTDNVNVHDHHVFLTVGRKIHDKDCQVPTLGVTWKHFLPVVYMPMWKSAPLPKKGAAFTSITQWNWGELHLGDRVLSISKRDAYLKYAELPRATKVPFELAANIGEDPEGDKPLLRRCGWRLVHPHQVARSPSAYRNYIYHSLAEISCAKPIYRELNTGWFSDRSAVYLASGRPVLAEDTGFSEKIPTGKGLIIFSNIKEAIRGVSQIVGDYERHCKKARELAEEFFDSRKCLPKMLQACGY